MRVTLERDEYVALVDLFFRYRQARKLLAIEHPRCKCGLPSVGCNRSRGSHGRLSVEARCEEHWKELENAPAEKWRIRWDDMDDLEIILSHHAKEVKNV